ncbi:hypothetical protein ES705_33983 [subsurface metagenome]
MEYLVKFNAMNRAIQECHKVDEIKLIRDKAEAWRYILIQAKASSEYVRMAEEIKLNAERKAGGIIKELQEQGELQKPGGDRKSFFEPPRMIPTLKEKDITFRQSFDWQKIDGIPNKDYFKYIKTQYEKKKQITTSGAVSLAKEIERENLRNELALEGKEIKLTDSDIQLINDDFREVDIEENSIDLVFTDPPYTGEDLDLWSDLSEFANKVLKPSSFLVTYAGHMYLPTLLNNLSEHLIYYWELCLYLPGEPHWVLGRNIGGQWRSILVFQKEPFRKLDKIVNDYLENDVRQKSLHPWQQGEDGAGKLIERFSKEGDLICDPMMGSGTFPYVAYKMKRRAIGIEINEEDFNISKGRITSQGLVKQSV